MKQKKQQLLQQIGVIVSIETHDCIEQHALQVGH